MFLIVLICAMTSYVQSLAALSCDYLPAASAAPLLKCHLLF